MAEWSDGWLALNPENTDLGRKLQGHHDSELSHPGYCPPFPYSLSPPPHPALASMPSETESSQPSHPTGLRGNNPALRIAEMSSFQSPPRWPEQHLRIGPGFPSPRASLKHVSFGQPSSPKNKLNVCLNIWGNSHKIWITPSS